MTVEMGLSKTELHFRLAIAESPAFSLALPTGLTLDF